MEDQDSVVEECILALRDELKTGGANVRVSAAKELLALLGAKDKVKDEEETKQLPLFGDIFQWRKKGVTD